MSGDIEGQGGGPETAEARPAIRVRGVGKRFRKSTIRRAGHTTLKSRLLEHLSFRELPDDAWVHALRDVDLDVAHGTTVGIIGRNGSGKSTLLKLIAGILHPDDGRVRVLGKISPLIELGAGFHPEFSGRENVFLNGLVLGMTREETEERFDDIVAFAGLGGFIDEPVRSYSSGMFMRLAFSVAIHADPDVLLIDEILAVGDEAFTAKCHERISALQEAGKTIVIVSHSIEMILRWCHDAVWMEQGRVAGRGSPESVAAMYHAAIEGEALSAEELAEIGRPDTRAPSELKARFEVLEGPERLPDRGELFRLLLRVTNEGDTIWRSLPPTRRGMVMVGGRIREGGRLSRETERALLPRDLWPKEAAVVELLFRVPGPGRHRVEIDLLAEEVCWFAERGSPVLALDIDAD